MNTVELCSFFFTCQHRVICQPAKWKKLLKKITKIKIHTLLIIRLRQYRNRYDLGSYIY